MSVRTVCLGWHWQPYRYTREASNVNGERVLPMPDWLIALGRESLRAVGDDVARSATNPTPLWSTTTATRRRWVCTRTRTSGPRAGRFAVGRRLVSFPVRQHREPDRPYVDLDLESGDLFVFGGPSRLAYHGVTRILPGTAPAGCGLESGRINVTLRVTGL